jgi:hypothetical protein
MWLNTAAKASRNAVEEGVIKRAPQLRLLNRVRVVFPFWEWPVSLQARIIEHAYEVRLEEAGDSSKRMDVERQKIFEAEPYWDKLREMRSGELIREARRLHIPTCDLSWDRGTGGYRFLDYQSANKLNRRYVTSAAAFGNCE